MTHLASLLGQTWCNFRSWTLVLVIAVTKRTTGPTSAFTRVLSEFSAVLQEKKDTLRVTGFAAYFHNVSSETITVGVPGRRRSLSTDYDSCLQFFTTTVESRSAVAMWATWHGLKQQDGAPKIRAVGTVNEGVHGMGKSGQIVCSAKFRKVVENETF